MTDDNEELATRWKDLAYEIRVELEGAGITEVLFEGWTDDPAFGEALRQLEVHNEAEETAMPPKIKKTYRKTVLSEIRRDIEDDVFLEDLEHDLDREAEHP